MTVFYPRVIAKHKGKAVELLDVWPMDSKTVLASIATIDGSRPYNERNSKTGKTFRVNYTTVSIANLRTLRVEISETTDSAVSEKWSLALYLGKAEYHNDGRADWAEIMPDFIFQQWQAVSNPPIDKSWENDPRHYRGD